MCCWDKPLAPALATGEVAIDPLRGRIAFPAAELPAGELSADFHFGLTAKIGAGPFARGDLPAATITVAKTRNAGFSSVQAALNAAPDNGVLPVVIEILDSAVYEEALSIAGRNFPGGLLIQSSALQTPLLRKPAAAVSLLDVATSAIPVLGLDGLMLSGGVVRLAGAVSTLRLRSCSLHPPSVSLQVSVPAAFGLQLQQCISGPISVSALGGGVPLQDSVVQHPLATIESPQAATALSFVNGVAALEKSTLLGTLTVRSASISNALCYGDVLMADLQASCLRFSRLPPTLASARAFRCTQATPISVSVTHGSAAYMHLHPKPRAGLLLGGANGRRIGACASPGSPRRPPSPSPPVA